MNWEKKLTELIGSRGSVVVHTIFFVAMFSLPYFNIEFNTVLLVLTTVVSLEAIYLAIFIQMTVNENTQSLQEVEDDIDEIQADVDEIQHDVDEIQEDVGEIQHDVDEIQEDVNQDKDSTVSLDSIRLMLTQLLDEVDKLKQIK